MGWRGRIARILSVFQFNRSYKIRREREKLQRYTTQIPCQTLSKSRVVSSCRSNRNKLWQATTSTILNYNCKKKVSRQYVQKQRTSILDSMLYGKDGILERIDGGEQDLTREQWDYVAGPHLGVVAGGSSTGMWPEAVAGARKKQHLENHFSSVSPMLLRSLQIWEVSISGK
jgi:hypothetical protein